MTETLKVGCMNYDRTRPLFDGRVTIDGVDASFESAPIVSDIFARMLRDRAFDVAELGLTFYLRTLSVEDPPFVALPVFPLRHFRHSAIFINTSSGIEKPQDLVGKTIGELGTYGHDAGIWPKGILSDDYGVTPDRCRWIVGGTNWPMAPFAFVPFIHPANVDVSAAPKDKALSDMLDEGQIDALISAQVPQCLIEGSPRVARLFADYESVEREYFAHTGIFPIMHTLVIRKELLASDQDLRKPCIKDSATRKTSRSRNTSSIAPGTTPMSWSRGSVPFTTRTADCCPTTGGPTVSRPIVKPSKPSCATSSSKVCRSAG